MRILWFAFFLSGIAGISYELVWAKYLVRLFGASTPAVSGTVSIFFGGLALGAIVGRLFDRLQRPVRGYGFLEIAIAVAAALVPWVVRLGESWVISLGDAGETWTARLLVAACVLLPPATLIGATFPAMAAVARRLEDPTRRTALFYGLNTLGAVLGCLLTGFWTMQALGLQATTWSMTLVNLVIGLLALNVAAKHPAIAPAPAAVSPGHSPRSSRRLGGATALVLAGGSGLLAIGTEVLWVRALVLSFFGTVYVFAMVLTAYLVGIGSGSLLLAFLRRRVRSEVKLLGTLYFAVGLFCIVAMALFTQLYGWGEGLRQSGVVTGWGSHIVAVGGMALLTMLPATLAMGASLPLLIGLSDVRGREGRTAGMLYGVNTLGGIVGSLAATFVLMPWLGLSGALMALAAGYFALVALLSRSMVAKPARRALVVAPLLVAVVMGLAGWYPEVNSRRARANEKTIFYQDAPSGTVGVYEKRNGNRTLFVNNYYGLSDTSPLNLLLQKRLGHLPLLMHPAPKRALLVGLATGVTLSAMARHPLERLDCIELHPTVVDIVDLFAPANGEVWREANVHIQKGDGRRYLARKGESYDVIVGDLYLPINAGVGALYSREHFDAARRRLADGGLFVAWLPLFQMGPGEVAIIARTFLEVFPDAEAWMANWGGRRPVLGLAGWKSPPSGERPHAGDIERRLWEFGAQEPGLEKQERVQSRQLLSNQRLRHWAGDAALNTFDHPVIEYSAPRALLRSWILDTPIAAENHAMIQRLLLMPPE